MNDLGRRVERELQEIAPPRFSIEEVHRVRARRRRNRKAGGGLVGAAAGLVVVIAAWQAVPGPDLEPADVPTSRIVFVSPGGGGRLDRLFTASPDGSELVRISDIHSEYPEWSPDGRSIAFDDGMNLVVSRLEIPNGDVYVVDADGSGLRRVSLHGGVSAPSWSPDGSRLAVAARRGGSASGISWLDLDTGELSPVTSNPYEGYWDAEPDVSPDGSKIAFVRIREVRSLGGERDLAALFVVNANGSGERRLTPWATDAATPAWSPDGSRIAFNTSDHFGAPQRIEVISANGTHPLTLFVSGQDIASFWPAWSPDGSSVAFTHVDTMSMPQSQLFVVPSGGGQAAPLMSEQEANQVGWSNVPSAGA